MESGSALFSRRLGRWFAAEAGNAVVEYALLLALLAGGLIVGAQFVGWSTSNALGRLDLQTAKAGGTAGAVLNAANEAAVARFRAGELHFTEIVPSCRAILEQHHFDPSPSLETLEKLDGWARQEVLRWVSV